MSKYARKRNKKGVAERATVEQRSKSNPPDESLKSLTKASDVLHYRHIAVESLAVISWELGGVNRGTLSAVENGDREPSKKLINRLNSAYGCHLHPKQVKIVVEVCPRCGATPTPRHRCPGAQTKYPPHPVARWRVIEQRAYHVLAILNAAHNNCRRESS